MKTYAQTRPCYTNTTRMRKRAVKARPDVIERGFERSVEGQYAYEAWVEEFVRAMTEKHGDRDGQIFIELIPRFDEHRVRASWVRRG